MDQTLRGVVANAKQEKRECEEELVTLEKQIFDLETRYLTSSANLLSGFGNFTRTVTARPVGPLDDSERLFSLSSGTSPLGPIPWPDHVLSRKAAVATSIPATGTVVALKPKKGGAITAVAAEKR